MSIVLPVEINKEFDKAFGFAMEYAEQTGQQLIVVYNYNIPFGYALPTNVYNVAVEKAKEKIHLHLLALKGAYHGHFKQWKAFNTPEIEVFCIEGNAENSILAVVKQQKDPILLLRKYFILTGQLSIKLLEALISAKTKIMLLPEEKRLMEIDPNLETDLFKIHKEVVFENTIDQLDIFCLPSDINLLKEEILIAMYV